MSDDRPRAPGPHLPSPSPAPASSAAPEASAAPPPIPSGATYGGQAVMEGVMIRGQRSMAVAVRRPDGEIEVRTEALGSLYTGALRRVPLVRGVIVLWETLALGMRALTWSSAVATGEVDADGEPQPLGLAGGLVLALVMVIGLAAFFAGPVLATAWLEGSLPTWLVVTLEGVLRLALLVGYIWAIGRSEDIGRVFQYHAAEHMSIHALEAGLPLTVPSVRRFAKEHPRCGTSFLLTVAVVAVVVFALLGDPPLWWRLGSRLLLIPLVAALAYEAIRYAGFHQRSPLVRWIFTGNIQLQRLTTRRPDDAQIQVAIASVEAAIAADVAADAAAGSGPPSPA